jgi:O-antigen/teichoic acid export membrane protein
VFSTVQSQRDELRRYFLVLTELLCYLALPVSFGMLVTADLVVAVVLGSQWEAVIVPLRILSIYSAFYSSQVLVGHLLLWTGRFRVNMWCSILAGVCMPVCFYLGARWGLSGIAWAWVIAFPLVNLPAFAIAFRAIGIDGRDWLRTFEVPLGACAVMVLAVVAVRSMLPPTLPSPVVLVASIATGVVAYGATLLLFWRRVTELWQFLRAISGSEPRPPNVPRSVDATV